MGHHNASGQQNQIKYSYLDNQDGSFDFAFVADRDGDLYHFQARLDAAAIEVTRPERKLEGAESSTLNGPAYCQARGVLGVGDVHPTRVDVQLVSAQSLRTLESSSVSEASAEGLVTPLYEEDGMIAADLKRRDLDAFRATGFIRLMYKSLQLEDPVFAEYAIDFSRWIPAEHQLIVFPHLS